MMISRANRHILSRLLAVLLLPLLMLGAVGVAAAAVIGHTQESGDFARLDPQARGFGVESKSVATPWAFWRLGADGDAAPSAPPEAGEQEVAPHIPLPVPAAIWMFGSGLGALALVRRRIGAWRRNQRPTAAVVRMARSIPPRHHQVRLALRERIRFAAAAGACSRREDGTAGMPPAPGGPGGPQAPGARQPFINPLTPRFDELALALTEQPDVALGRRFGMPCLKFGKRPFVAFDQTSHDGIAFRVGEQAAAELQAEMPQLDYWNPKHERQPKRSWLVCNVCNGELLVHLAAVAYEQALKDGARTAVNQEGCFPAAELVCA